LGKEIDFHSICQKIFLASLRQQRWMALQFTTQDRMTPSLQILDTFFHAKIIWVTVGQNTLL